MRSLMLALFVLAASCNSIYAYGDTSGGPNPQALAEFDSAANGGTGLSEAVEPVDRDEMQEEHRMDCDIAEEDELWGIDNYLMYEHARKEGWVDED
jgi:hypothetical protein